MSSVGRAIKRVLLWSYERGTWQYDVLCLVILAFIFLTPRSLFDGSTAGGAQERPSKPPVQKPADEQQKKVVSRQLPDEKQGSGSRIQDSGHKGPTH